MSGLYPKRRQFFVPFNGKIADITEADTNTHLLTLANAGGTGAIAGETRKVIMVICGFQRIAGTGGFRLYPNEGANTVTFSPIIGTSLTLSVVIADGTQRVQYSQTVANDDWDLYCFGYVVEA